jgi:hypothetical protein
MTGNPAHGLLPDLIRNPSFRAKQADALSSLPLPRKVGLRREKSLLDSIGSFADFLLRRLRLNLLLCSAVLVLAIGLNAQAPIAVPIPKEPHHHLVFENSYVRVFRVSVPAHEATLPHQHDVPYLYVSLGPADVINAVEGKPEVRLVMADGQLGYSPGHFAHIARTDAGSSFDNVTIELLRPQGEPRNLCEKIIDGPLGACNQPAPSQPGSNSQARVPPRVFETRPLFRTDGVRAVSVSLGARAHFTEAAAKFGMLFVIGNDSVLQIDLPGEPSRSLHGGEVLWIAQGGSATITSPLERGTSHYWVLFFQDEKSAKQPKK